MYIISFQLLQLHVFGAYTQVYYQRYVLKTLGVLMQPWRSAPQLEIEDLYVRVSYPTFVSNVPR